MSESGHARRLLEQLRLAERTERVERRIQELEEELGEDETAEERASP